MRQSLGKTKAFTLIELMLVVAIIGLLAAIAIPKFANLIIKAKEAGVKGHLGTLRSTVSIYYADNEGFIPIAQWGFSSLDQILVPKYIREIPSISIPTVPESIHPRSNRSRLAMVRADLFWAPGASNPWGLMAVPVSPPGIALLGFFGKIGINCDHPDSSGRVWSTY